MWLLCFAFVGQCSIFGSDSLWHLCACHCQRVLPGERSEFVLVGGRPRWDVLPVHGAVGWRVGPVLLLGIPAVPVGADSLIVPDGGGLGVADVAWLARVVGWEQEQWLRRKCMQVPHAELLQVLLTGVAEQEGVTHRHIDTLTFSHHACYKVLNTGEP